MNWALFSCSGGGDFGDFTVLVEALCEMYL